MSHSPAPTFIPNDYCDKEGILHDDDTDVDDDNEDDDAPTNPMTMPLLRYHRLVGSLPRTPVVDASSAQPLVVHCTASCMGKVVVTESEPLPTNIMAVGYSDGRIQMLNVATGVRVSDQDLYITSNDTTTIVGVALDASGTQLAAIDARGQCCVWEFVYAMTRIKQSLSTPLSSGSSNGAAVAAAVENTEITTTGEANSPVIPNTTSVGGAFSNLFSVLTGGGGQKQESSRTAAATQPILQSSAETTNMQQQQSEQQQETLVPTLSVVSFTVQQINYPKSFGRPTCLAIDPRRNKRSLVVGFHDGRLVLTKRSGVFARRADATVYQGTCGRIQAAAWRGSLVAWADNSGVRLLDADTFARVAHMDRPNGAAATVASNSSTTSHACLCFETATSLLVAWGDCLLSLRVREQRQLQQSQSQQQPLEQQQQQQPTEQQRTRRRTVECNMAWQLDCVATGIVPIDERHVGVLGLIPTQQQQQQSNNNDTTTDVDDTSCQDVELQVVSRADGSVVYADLLPLLRQPPPKKKETRWLKSSKEETAAPYFALLSSFAVPRMDDASELREQRITEQDDNYQSSLFGSGAARMFRDLHLKWTLDMVAFNDDDGDEDDLGNTDHQSVASDTNSVTSTYRSVHSENSDTYEMIFDPIPEPKINSYGGNQVAPPLMIVISGSDIVLARVRTVDDAISSALENNRASLALRRGLCYIRQLRQYDIRDLVNEYFRALLRLPKEDEDSLVASTEPASPLYKLLQKRKSHRHLSLHRMKLASEAMPILLGGDVSMWTRWIHEFEKIPGAMFMARRFIPVRDPVLPKAIYSSALERMLQQVEDMSVGGRLVDEAVGHFLDTLLAWGSMTVLDEFSKLFQAQALTDSRFTATVRSMEDSLKRRKEQTAANYLQFSSPSTAVSFEAAAPAQLTLSQSNCEPGPLFDIERMAETVLGRLSKLQPNSPRMIGSVQDGKVDSRVALEAMARLSMMKGSRDDALRYYLLIGTHHSTKRLDEIEDEAVRSVMTFNKAPTDPKPRESYYVHVLSIIEHHHLHQCLLDPNFVSKDDKAPPLLALLQLVGVEYLGKFLIDNCVLPQNQFMLDHGCNDNHETFVDKTGGERRGTLPLDLVATQLDGRPKLLHWYLDLVFRHKPDIYVNFPTTANPPESITKLHRKHVDLYIKFSGDKRDSAKAMEGIEPYRVTDASTPLLSFLKVVMELGTVQASEIAKKLEIERKGRARDSKTFALELAYLMEQYGDDTVEGARLILELYLKGTQNLMLAVSYAQRAKHSDALWMTLVDHCLASFSEQSSTGSLYGSLLEAAALSGADLAHLVAKIPTEMAVEGLRPRLVAAVADSRLNLQLRETASKIANTEKVDLLREVGYRSRRGVRVQVQHPPDVKILKKADDTMAISVNETTSLIGRRTIVREDRPKPALALPVR